MTTYIDMFHDSQTINTYSSATSSPFDSSRTLKFAEVFNNNSFEFDANVIYSGYPYHYLRNVVEGLFAGQGDGNSLNSLVLVDGPAISVSRIENVDAFTYNVVLDLRLSQNKSYMDNHKGDNFWTIGNATIKDILCVVKIVPNFNGKKMGYVVEYAVPDSESNALHDATYDSVIYSQDGIVKTKAIQKRTVKVSLPSGISWSSHSSNI